MTNNKPKKIKFPFFIDGQQTYNNIYPIKRSKQMRNEKRKIEEMIVIPENSKYQTNQIEDFSCRFIRDQVKILKSEENEK